MTDEELKQRIRAAVEHTAPDDFARILFLCREEDRENPSAFFRRRPAANVAFRILLDVNPSICLEVDEGERVIRAEALNEDAGKLPGMEDLVGLSLTVAVDAIVESMLQEGYLSESQNSILLSVGEPGADRPEEMRKIVSGIIGEVLEETGEGASVLIQRVDEDDEEAASLAGEYGISMGKAALILKLAAKDEEVRKELVPLTVNEIALLTQERGLKNDSVKQVGRASERAYIGHDGALRAAAACAGVALSQVTKPKVTLDAEGGRMVYDVKLKTTAGKFKYILDARTGEPLRRKKGKGKNNKNKKEGSKGMSKKKKKKYYKKMKKYYKKQYKATRGMNGIPGMAPPSDFVIQPTSEGAQLEEEAVLPEGEGTQPEAGSAQPAAGVIGEQAAKEAALNHAGVPESQALYVYCNPQVGHGPDHYDVKFVANGFKYKYAIGLYDGAVLGRAVKNKAAKGKYVYEGNYHEHYAPMGEGMAQPAAAGAAAQPAAGGMVSEPDALAIALRQAGLTQNDLIRWKVKMRDKHGRLLYRFKLKIPGFEHEIDVDAYTGAVTKHHKEVDY